jgi:uncharacterized protein involved in type VI secretion and phage assembly
MVPEVGDEVLVAFEQGSFQRPYVLGGLYNGVDKPDAGDVTLIDDNSGTVDRRAFVSRTGHRLEMVESASGDQGIVLRTGDKKLSLQLDQKGTKVTLHSDGTVSIEAKGDITVKTDSGNVTVTADGGNVSLKGQKVSVEGQQVEIKGQTGVTVDGGTQASISALQVKIN